MYNKEAEKIFIKIFIKINSKIREKMQMKDSTLIYSHFSNYLLTTLFF